MSEEVKILVVEDSKLDRELLKIILNVEPYVVEVVDDGEAACAIVDSRPPVAIVVTDVNLPKFSGIELTKYIRDNSEWCDVPIIALSSLMNAKTVIALNQSGASSILSKPYNPERLQQEVFKLTGYERIDP